MFFEVFTIAHPREQDECQLVDFCCIWIRTGKIKQRRSRELGQTEELLSSRLRDSSLSVGKFVRFDPIDFNILMEIMLPINLT